MRTRTIGVFGLVFGALLAGCNDSDQREPAPESRTYAFADVTATHVPVEPELHALDVAAGDFDRDGDVDVALAVEGGVNRYYRNDGAGRFTFVAGVFGEVLHDSEHVDTADIDGDGLLDLVFVAEDDEQHQLFLGRGDGTFLDVTERLPARSEGNALAVGDVNGDALPDIVVGNSNEGGGDPANFLWVNDAASPGHFIDRSSTTLPRDVESTQSVALADLDGDGDLDMVVGNQTPPNRLLRNDGTGVFTDATELLDQPVATETREVHIFDANRDGRPDIFFSNITSNAGAFVRDPQSRLLVQQADGRFLDVTRDHLPAHRFSSWSAEVIDFDRDGALDLVVSAIEVPGFTPLQVRAWRNDGQGRYVDMTASVIPDSVVGRTWGMARADFDADGHDDLFLGQWGTQARLLLSRESGESR